MEILDIPADRDTLGVRCDPTTGEMAINGVSYPQNASEFFRPIYEWLEQYSHTVRGPVRLNLRISYLNTSSTKCMFDLMDMLEAYAGEGAEVAIHWYYEASDQDMMETGAEFKEDIELPFELIAY